MKKPDFLKILYVFGLPEKQIAKVSKSIKGRNNDLEDLTLSRWIGSAFIWNEVGDLKLAPDLLFNWHDFFLLAEKIDEFLQYKELEVGKINLPDIIPDGHFIRVKKSLIYIVDSIEKTEVNEGYLKGVFLSPDSFFNRLVDIHSQKLVYSQSGHDGKYIPKFGSDDI